MAHLATAIVHGAEGFVTRDRPILLASDQILDRFNLRVLPPSSFVEPTLDSYQTIESIQLQFEGTVRVSDATRLDPAALSEFIQRIGGSIGDFRSLTQLGVNTALVALQGARIVALAAWDSPSAVQRVHEFDLLIDEDCRDAKTLAEHFLAVVQQHVARVGVSRLRLRILASQLETTDVACRRGFVAENQSHTPSRLRHFSKIVVGGAIGPNEWSTTRREILRISNFELPEQMPTSSQVRSKGVVVRQGQQRLALPMGTFEILFSPGLFLFPGRRGVILPIRQRFAVDLIAGADRQLSLVPRSNAFLEQEKSYFRRPAGISAIEPGMVVFLYESGRGGGCKSVIGAGRVTQSAVQSIDRAIVRVAKSGVLTRRELESCANRRGAVHVVAFESFQLLPSPVSIEALREEGIVDGSNLITARVISHDQVNKILKKGDLIG